MNSSGRHPNDPNQFNTRLNPRLKAQLKDLAKAKGITIEKVVEDAFRRYLGDNAKAISATDERNSAINGSIIDPAERHGIFRILPRLKNNNFYNFMRKSENLYIYATDLLTFMKSYDHEDALMLRHHHNQPTFITVPNMGFGELGPSLSPNNYFAISRFGLRNRPYPDRYDIKNFIDKGFASKFTFATHKFHLPSVTFIIANDTQVIVAQDSYLSEYGPLFGFEKVDGHKECGFSHYSSSVKPIFPFVNLNPLKYELPVYWNCPLEWDRGICEISNGYGHSL